MGVFCGIDWAETHHDVAVVDAEGRLLARRRIRDDAAGYQQLLQLLAEAGDTATEPIPVAIETSRGLLVAFLRATSRRVYAINPWPCTGYRDRHGVAGAKSDHADAVVLAGILRTDAAAHRPLPADSELVQAIAVLARAQQDAVWSRQQLAMKLRWLLREFFPAALAAFHRKHVGLTAPEARAVLAAAPTPTQAASLTTAQLRRLLRCAGRQRNLDAWTKRLRPASTPTSHASSHWSSRPWASRSWPCSPSYRPPARPLTTSPRPPSRSSAATPTTRSSPASLAWGS